LAFGDILLSILLEVFRNYIPLVCWSMER